MYRTLLSTSLWALALVGCTEAPELNGSTGRILPDSVRLDISELADGAAAAVLPAGELTPQGSLLQAAILEADNTLAQLDEIMTRFSQINALVTDPYRTQVSGTIIWDTRVEGAVPGAGGSRVPNPGSGSGETRGIKIDVAAFDFDGDGVAEGSGYPSVEPVALRIWVQDAQGVYQPAACGLISVRPTDEHEGAGTLLTLSYARNGDGDIARIQWAQADPADKLLETWDEHPEGPGGWSYSSFLVQHRAVGGTTEKTFKSTIGHAGPGEFVAARYYTTAEAALVRGDQGGENGQLPVNPSAPVYVNMATLEPATAEDAGNVSSTDFDLLDYPDPDGFVWPAAFPQEPTF